MSFNFLFLCFLGVSSHFYAAVMAYVTNGDDYTVSAIDTSTNTVVNTIPTGYYPVGLRASSDGKLLFVTAFGEDNIYVINTSTNTLSYTIGLPKGSHPISIATSPAGTVYVTNFSAASISYFNQNQGTITDTYPVGAMFPFSIAVSGDGARAYVACGLGPKNVKSFNTSTNFIVGTANAGQQSFGIAISPDSSKIYVTNPLQSSVSVINTSTLATTTTIALPANSFPRGIAVAPNGLTAYVALQGSSSLGVINASTNTFTTAIPLAANSEPYNVAVTPNSAYAYVTQTLAQSVAVVDTNTNTVENTINVGNFPYDITIVTTP
jgi:YVTN family beta-propeller protein